MAGTFRKKGNKWELCVSCASDLFGKRTRKYKYVDGDIGKREIEKILANFVVECDRLKTNNNMTLDNFIGYWHTEHALKQYKKQTIRFYERFYSRVKIALGHKKITEITPNHIMQFINMLSKDGIREDGKKGGLDGQTIKHYYAFLSVLLQIAFRWQMIPENVVRRVKSPNIGNKVKIMLDLKEVSIILEKLENEDPKYKLAILVFIYTGIRKSELLALEWTDIDLDNKVISISKSRYYVPKAGEGTGTTKNNSSVRVVDITDNIVNLLKEHKKTAKSNIVFSNSTGGYLFNTSLYRFWNKFLSKNNIKHVNIHSLRHLNASMLVKAGVDFATIAQSLGHANTDMLIKTYAHAVNKSKTSNIIEKIISAETLTE